MGGALIAQTSLEKNQEEDEAGVLHSVQIAYVQFYKERL